MSCTLQREGRRNHGRLVGDKRHQSTWRGEREERGGEGIGREGKERRGRGGGEEGERRGRGKREERERRDRGGGEERERRARGGGKEGKRRGRGVEMLYHQLVRDACSLHV